MAKISSKRYLKQNRLLTIIRRNNFQIFLNVVTFINVLWFRDVFVVVVIEIMWWLNVSSFLYLGFLINIQCIYVCEKNFKDVWKLCHIVKGYSTSFWNKNKIRWRDNHFLFFSIFLGKTTQMHNVFQILSNSRRSQISHVRSHRNLAIQVPRLPSRIQQTNQFKESSTFAFR